MTTDGTHPVPRREVAIRVHAVAVIASAIDAGTWAAEVEILDQLVSLIGAASRWAVLVELDDGTA